MQTFLAVYTRGYAKISALDADLSCVGQLYFQWFPRLHSRLRFWKYADAVFEWSARPFRSPRAKCCLPIALKMSAR